MLCRAILRLLPSPPADVTAKALNFAGRDLLKLKPAEMRKIRGQDIAMVFQNPMTSLNPVWPIGDQVSEGIARPSRNQPGRGAQGGDRTS